MRRPSSWASDAQPRTGPRRTAHFPRCATDDVCSCLYASLPTLARHRRRAEPERDEAPPATTALVSRPTLTDRDDRCRNYTQLTRTKRRTCVAHSRSRSWPKRSGASAVRSRRSTGWCCSLTGWRDRSDRPALAARDPRRVARPPGRPRAPAARIMSAARSPSTLIPDRDTTDRRVPSITCFAHLLT